jgi:glycosyltransferase involved in cell wall biosynthesis
MNFHVLLDVMRAFPGYDLYISGEDRNEYAMEIRGRIKTGGLANVFLTGAIGQAGKIWLYRHCEAFFFPTLLEGFGLPVIEAMQFGKPVFSSNRTSLPEICGGHAFLWDNFDAEYMIQSRKNFTVDFHSDPGRAEKEKAHAATFGYDKHIAEYLKLYRMPEGTG